jgi:hypothetical protein
MPLLLLGRGGRREEVKGFVGASLSLLHRPDKSDENGTSPGDVAGLSCPFEWRARWYT